MADGSSLDLSGIFIPSASPFDPVSGDLDIVAHRMNVRSWLEHPVRGIVVGGSTGEAVYLDDDERTLALEATRDLLDDGRLMIAGTGAESTRRTIQLSKAAIDLGADALLVQPPSFYKGAMSDDVVRDHFVAVADAVSAPVILYQVPLRFSTLDWPTDWWRSCRSIRTWWASKILEATWIWWANS